jgi:hypothetical protein
LLASSFNGKLLKPLVVFKAKPGGAVEKEFKKKGSQYSGTGLLK